LDFLVLAGRRLFQNRKDRRRQDVAADHGQPRGGLLQRRLLDEVGDFEERRTRRFSGDDPVTGYLLGFDLVHAQDRSAQSVMPFDQLPDGRDRRIEHLITEDHREGFIPDEVLGAEDRVPQSPGVPLADITKICQLRDPADFVEQLLFSAFFEILLQLEGQVEVVFDGPFPSARDDDDVFNAGTDRFLDSILDQWFVDQRQHLFGRGFRGGQEPGSEASGGNDGLRDFPRRHIERILRSDPLNVKRTGESRQAAFSLYFFQGDL